MSQARSTLKQKLFTAESELKHKEEYMSVASNQYTGDFPDLHARMGELLSGKDQLVVRNDDLQQKLDKM